jgi:hypothetical protein
MAGVVRIIRTCSIIAGVLIRTLLFNLGSSSSAHRSGQSNCKKQNLAFGDIFLASGYSALFTGPSITRSASGTAALSAAIDTQV